MREISGTALSLTRVTALFEGGALSFLLPGGATFEDLADRVDQLGARVDGQVIAIKVRFGLLH